MSPRKVLMADEAFATGKVPPGYSVIAGYLSSPAAYHPWSDSDWAKFGTMKKLPIFVASKATGDSDAFSCLEQLYKLRVPKGSAVGLDMETAVDTSYVRDFSDALRWAGYRTWVYGSASSVFHNPQPSWGGYWVADYKGTGPFMYKHPGVRATQYESGSEYDSSLIKWWDYLVALKSW